MIEDWLWLIVGVGCGVAGMMLADLIWYLNRCDYFGCRRWGDYGERGWRACREHVLEVRKAMRLFESGDNDPANPYWKRRSPR
jgi:hypothetical protein